MHDSSLPSCILLLVSSTKMQLLCVQIGKLKRRIYPSDITLNIGKDARIPECPIPGERSVIFFHGFSENVNSIMLTMIDATNFADGKK